MPIHRADTIPIVAPATPCPAVVPLTRAPLSAAPHQHPPIADAMSVQLAVVDANWRIVSVNDSWREAATTVGYGALLALGSNYKRFCEWCLMSGIDPAQAVLDGIAAIDEGRARSYSHGYTSALTGEQLQLSIATFETAGKRFATVSRIDVKELMGLRRERTRLNAHLMMAQSKLLRVQEDERKRIARELHDTAAQQLTGMNLSLAHLRQVSSDPLVQSVADDIGGMLDLFCRDVRGLTYVLHPPQIETSGLHEAVRSLCTGLAARAGVDVALQIHGIDRMRGSTVEATLYRVLQEALINVHRHSGASHIRVRLSERPKALILIVEDNGVGLKCGRGSAASSGVGVPGMEARVRELDGRFVFRNRRRDRGAVLGAIIPRQGAGQAFLTEDLTAIQLAREDDKAITRRGAGHV